MTGYWVRLCRGYVDLFVFVLLTFGGRIFKFFTSVFGFKLVNTFLSGKFLILLAGEDQSTD